MPHLLSASDLEFKERVERRMFPASEFNHRAHLRLAYVYLVENDPDDAVTLMRQALFELLKSAGVDPSTKFHETLTRAWVLAVAHFMQRTEDSEAADRFIDRNPWILDPKIMLSHYSCEVLFSDRARREYVEPDLEPIPRYGATPR